MEWLRKHMLGSAAFVDFDDATGFYTCHVNVIRAVDVAVGERDLAVPAPSAVATTLPGMPTNAAGNPLPVLEAMAGSVASDPGASQDSTQGYQVGSVVFNNTAGFLRTWKCRDATAGAAKWVFEGADFANGGTNPPTEQTQAGSSTATIAAEGNIFRTVLATPGNFTGANGSDVVLALWTLPANFFDGVANTNRGLTITAQGSFGGTGNNKECKIIIGASGGTVGGVVGGGGTAIADTGTVSTNGGGWSIQANVFKYGAAGSNTQLGIHQQSQCGSTVQALLAPQNLTLTENAAIIIAVTGKTTTLTNDISFCFGEVNALN